MGLLFSIILAVYSGLMLANLILAETKNGTYLFSILLLVGLCNMLICIGITVMNNR